MRFPKTLKRAAALALALGGLAVAPSVAAAQVPILVVSDGGFGRYYQEILRAEGLNSFDVSTSAALNAGSLAPYDVVVLAEGSGSAQAGALADWVQAGGNLVAMRPDAALAGVLGLGGISGQLPEVGGYMDIDTTSPPGAGITTESMQYHGTADLWSLTTARSVAALVGTAANNPAVTLNSIGSAGGQAAAFTYDLARSVVYTRQGNPAWIGLDRDGSSPVRSDDLFFPGDWLDSSKVRIPQADEQQRLLANLISEMSLDRTPMPRFWYLPNSERAAVVMTGDDHENDGGTEGQFQGFESRDPVNCSAGVWQCVRATSYLFPGGGGALSNADAVGFQNKGFEIALHHNTSCSNPADLSGLWAGQLASFGSEWPGAATPTTNRTHCIAWNNWVDTAVAERARGIRLDTNYYYWPAAWVQNRPGMFTGSGFPMRFADTDGELVDVYQAATQLTDESGIDYGLHIESLLDGALLGDGYYGAFTANMHTDNPTHDGAGAIVDEAVARGVPVISAKQLLDWTVARNASVFRNVDYSGGVMTFDLDATDGLRGLQAMLPRSTAHGPITSLTRNGQAVGMEALTVKGIAYHRFAAVDGSYVVTYGIGTPGTTPPATDPTPGTGGAGAGSGTKPGAGGSGGGAATSVRAAHVRSRNVRASRSGTVRLRVKCPPGEALCRVTLRIRRNGKQIVTRRVVNIDPGVTRTVTFRLTRSARIRLTQAGSLRAEVTATTRSGAASPATTRNRIRLLAPRR